MTFEEYIVNPMQKQGKVFNAVMREAMRTNYTNRFNNILLREAGKINHYKFKNSKTNEYIILVKIPSEVVKNFYYDVVIKFSANTDTAAAGTLLNKYNIQVFSNDPAFNFTYAYVFLKNGLVIKDLEPKLAKLARKETPKVTNPEEQVGYVKSLYFAYLFMQQRGLFKVITWSDSEEYDRQKLLSLVENSDTKIDDRIREGKKVDTRKKIEVSNAVARKINSLNISDTDKARVVTTTKKTPIVKNIKAINSTKKSKRK